MGVLHDAIIRLVAAGHRVSHKRLDSIYYVDGIGMSETRLLEIAADLPSPEDYRNALKPQTPPAPSS